MHDELAARFEEFADWSRGTSPLYRALAEAIAADEDLLEYAATIPGGKSRPHVLLASVQYRLLEGTTHPLSAYYPSCTDEPRAPDEALASTFADFLETYADDLRESFETRRTQTNAVRRCTALYPAFAHVSREVGGRPFALVEVGPSAGLNLCWDRYAYRYAFEADELIEAGGTSTVDCGDPDSGLTLETTVRGPERPPLPADPPAVEARVGVDLNPLSVTDPDDVRWLEALVWPEHTTRRRLLREAADVARSDPPDLRAGDALEVLPDVLDEFSAETPVCVFDTQVLYQFPEAERRAFVDLLEDLAREREGALHWLSGNEVDARESAIRLGWGTLEDGALETRPLAHYEAHGRWLEWRADAERRDRNADSA